MTLATIPSVNSLLQSLWDYFNNLPEIYEIAVVQENHPRSPGEILEEQGRIVMSILPMDLSEGRVVSESLLTPRIQFACWGTTNYMAQRLKELLRRAVEHMAEVNLNAAMIAAHQVVCNVHRAGGTGPIKSSATDLFVATLDVDFFLNSIGR